VDKATYDAALAEARTITERDHDVVVEAGGLHIIGTERHESRRIDNQLRGRAGRQGDPGSSRFYLSLEDDLMKRFASERMASLMERLGLEEDVAIESRLVSRTIEQAQSRVEGFNFDIRKRVVEFDDVINRQRETIYAERDKVLRNEDLTETVRSFLDDEMEVLVDQFTAGPDPDQWHLDGLATALKAMGLDGEGASEEALWAVGGRDALVEHLRDLADAKLEARAQEHGEELWSQVERVVLLRTIDSLWVEHLTEVDDMRRGIGLRGYAQQDPLNEFRKEAFRLYQELRDLIRRQVAGSIFRVTVTRQPAPPPSGVFAMQGPGQRPAAVGAGADGADGLDGADGADGADGGAVAGTPVPAAAGAAGSAIRRAGSSVTAAGPIAGALPPDPMRTAREVVGGTGGAPGGDGQGARPGYTPAGQRIGRNDPCWCGSGQKYKKCHGR